MKNSIIKLVSAILSLVLVFSVFAMTVSATDSSNDSAPMFLNTPASLYFSSLKSNFGNNSRNSCGYIAVAMLLSYYDNYWNGGIVPDLYNQYGEYALTSGILSVTNSPRIKKDPWPIQNANLSYDEVISIIGPYGFFHLELLRIARDELRDLEEFDIMNQEIDPSIDDDGDNRWYTNDEKLIILLNYYFNNYLSLRDENGTTDYVTVNHDTYENYELNHMYDPSQYDPDDYIRNKIINKLKEGTPVIYMADPPNGSIGHVMIAYDYDEANDAIYLHYGWPSSNNRKFYVSDRDPDFIYTENISTIWLDIDETELAHQCSRFYENIADNSYHCMCEFHEYLVHKHIGEYEQGNFTSLTHNISCDWCGVVAENHFESYYERNTKYRHKTFCACGYMMGTYPHILPSGSQLIKSCICCGEIIDLGFDTGVDIHGTIPVITYITDSGSYVDSNGIIYLVESDMALYLDGNLDVYSLLYNNETQ